MSFGHVGFFAIGAYSVAILHAQFGLGPFVATACGLAINGAVSYVLGRVCLRLSGSYFMLGTLAFGIMMHGVITVWYSITGGDGGLGGIPRPQIGAVEAELGLVVRLVGLGLRGRLFWGSYNLSCSKVGRAARAIRSDEIAAACLGINVPRVKMNLFVISAGFASLGGSLFATYNGAVHPDSFSLGTLLDLLLMLFFGGEGTIWGGLLGTTFMRLLPDIASDLHGAKILFSGVLFTVIILALPRGIAGAINDLIDRLRIRDASPPASAVVGIPFELSHVPSETLLGVENVSRSFGGVRAVDDVTLTVKNGRIKGLIGPNGAGKSTLMNLISGIMPIDAGRIVLDGTPLQGLLPHEIAWSGFSALFSMSDCFHTSPS